MTQTLTTETVKLWRRNAEITADETAEHDPEHIAAKAILALTAEILANREAQPVGFYTTVSGRGGVVWHNGAPADDTAIYTAPPAPAVPDEMTFSEAENFIKKLTPPTEEEAAMFAWNSCRAAVLAAAPEGGN
jgi:hypothetical protein